MENEHTTPTGARGAENSQCENQQTTGPLVTIAGMPQEPQQPKLPTWENSPFPIPNALIIPPIPPKKKNYTKLLLGLGAVVLVAVVGIFLARDQLTMRFLPKEYLIAAQAHTAEVTIREDEEKTALWQTPNIVQNIMKQPVHIGYQVDGATIYSNQGYSGEIHFSVPDNRIYSSTSSYEDEASLNRVTYLSDDQFIFAMPTGNFWDRALLLNPQTFVQEFNQKYGSTGGDLPDGTSIQFDLASLFDADSSSISDDESAALAKELEPLVADLLKYADVQYSGNKAMAIPDTEYAFSGNFFTVTITEKQFKAYLNNILTVLLDNEQFWEQVMQDADPDGEMTASQRRAARSLIAIQVNNYFDQELSLPNGLVTTIGVTKDKVINYVQVDTTLIVENEVMPLRFTILIHGAPYRTNALYFDMNMGEGMQSIRLVCDYETNTGLSSKEEFRANLLGSVAFIKLSGSVSGSYDRERAADNLTATMVFDLMGSTMTADAVGTMVLDTAADRCAIENMEIIVKQTSSYSSSFSPHSVDSLVMDLSLLLEPTTLDAIAFHEDIPQVDLLAVDLKDYEVLGYLDLLSPYGVRIVYPD